MIAPASKDFLLTHTYNNGRGHKVITITGGYNNKIAFMQTTSQDSNGNVQDDPAYGTRWLINRIFEYIFYCFAIILK